MYNLSAENPTANQQAMERVLSSSIFCRALKRVQRKEGSAGIDGMRVDNLPAYLSKHWPELREQLLAGRYRPAAVRHTNWRSLMHNEFTAMVERDND